MWFHLSMAATAVLGAAFLYLEITEFAHLVAVGAGPTRSAFLSAFFTLVGCHGLHVSMGMLWLLTMMAQVYAKGFRAGHHAAHAVLRPVLACARHHLGGPVHGRLSSGSGRMTDAKIRHGHHSDLAPGDEGGGDAHDVASGVRGYLIGLALAVGLTAVSFWLGSTRFLYGPGLPIMLCVLAIAQMGVHLVFFLHLTTAADNTNNALALAFGVLIVFLLIAGSLFIMANLNHNMMPMDQMMRMQR